MKRSEKTIRVQAILDELFPRVQPPLDHYDHFTLLVAVLLSAQCTDRRVNLVTPKLFKVAPNVQQMARTPVETILEIIQSCGLAPSKAKNIRKLSEILVENHGGNVPCDLDALEALPGVGHKTASVVMSQGFGIPAFPVDTHIHRLSARWGLSNGTTVEKTELDLKGLFPSESWNRLHIQMIEFGRAYCPARFHDLAECPICSWAASKQRIQTESKRDRTGKKSGKKIAEKSNSNSEPNTDTQSTDRTQKRAMAKL